MPRWLGFRATIFLLTGLAGVFLWMLWPTRVTTRQSRIEASGQHAPSRRSAGELAHDDNRPNSAELSETPLPPRHVDADPFAEAENHPEQHAAGLTEAADRPAHPGAGSIAAKSGRGTARGKRPPPYNPDQTSWESPFDRSCWEGAGWDFSDLAMQAATHETEATFRRPYRRLMLECLVEPLAEPVSPFRVQLAVPEIPQAMTLAIDGHSIRVTESAGGETRIVKEVHFVPAWTMGQLADLRLAATGNRLIVSWNGKSVLACDQPAAHSGREFHFTFATGETRYRISEMRVEGE